MRAFTTAWQRNRREKKNTKLAPINFPGANRQAIHERTGQNGIPRKGKRGKEEIPIFTENAMRVVRGGVSQGESVEIVAMEDSEVALTWGGR